MCDFWHEQNFTRRCCRIELCWIIKLVNSNQNSTLNRIAARTSNCPSPSLRFLSWFCIKSNHLSFLLSFLGTNIAFQFAFLAQSTSDCKCLAFNVENKLTPWVEQKKRDCNWKSSSHSDPLIYNAHSFIASWIIQLSLCS